MEKLRTRLFACGTAAFMFLNALPLQTALTAFAAEAEAASRGDVNGDGKRNKDDLAALVKLLGEHPETIFAEKDFVQYDVTEDGIIDVRDQYALSQVLSGASAEIPVKPGTALDESLTLAMTNANCFPGDEFRIALSVVDWTKDIAAYEITVGFDSALKLKDVSFISGDCQYAAAGRHESRGSKMYIEGLDDIDNRILDAIRDNAVFRLNILQTPAIGAALLKNHERLTQ